MLWKQHFFPNLYYEIYIHVDYLKIFQGQYYSDTKTRKGGHKKITGQQNINNLSPIIHEKDLTHHEQVECTLEMQGWFTICKSM